MQLGTGIVGDQLHEAVVNQLTFIHDIARVDAGVVPTRQLAGQAAHVVGRREPPDRAIDATAERRHPVVQDSAQLVAVVSVNAAALIGQFSKFRLWIKPLICEFIK